MELKSLRKTEEDEIYIYFDLFLMVLFKYKRPPKRSKYNYISSCFVFLGDFYFFLSLRCYCTYFYNWY